jgi:acyl carrier protein
MTDEDRLNKVRGAFQAAFGADPALVTPTSTPDQIPGWDSLGHAVLVTQLEQAFGVTFELDEIMDMEDVKAILAIVAKRTG